MKLKIMSFQKFTYKINKKSKVFIQFRTKFHYYDIIYKKDIALSTLMWCYSIIILNHVNFNWRNLFKFGNRVSLSDKLYYYFNVLKNVTCHN